MSKVKLLWVMYRLCGGGGGGSPIDILTQIFPGYAQQVSYCCPDISGFSRTWVRKLKH